MDLQALVEDMQRVAEADASARAERDAMAAEAHRARKVALWRSDYVAAVPVRAAREAWDARETPAVSAVRNWLDRGAQCHIVLRGGVGVGKTTAACVAAKRWLEPYEVMVNGAPEWRSAPPISWLRQDQLVSAVLHSYDDKSPRIRAKVVVEDWGRHERNLADATEALCALLDMPDVTVLVTTNLTKQQMRERYDGRLLDRLRDTCMAVDLAGASLRRASDDF